MTKQPKPNLKAIYNAQQTILRELGAAYHIGNPAAPGPTIPSAEAAGINLSEMALLTQEQLRVLCVNTRYQLLEEVTVAMGTGNTTHITPREVFRPAITCGATQIMIAHNHPSGDPTPSPQDVALTATIFNAGKLLNIELLDHIIIGRERYLSMRTKGLWPKGDGATQWS